MSPRALLLDLEGTAVSVAFVQDTLFPYANENVEKFLTASWDKKNVQEAVEGMRQQAIKDVENKVDGAIPIPGKDCSKEDQITAVSKNLRWLNDIGNKGTHMKKLSGYIWQYGYENGDIKGHIYDDVYPAIQTWKSNGKKVYIYSSGSVLAQKLLVKYSVSGDLEPVIDDYFDTEVGNKREVSSYNNILEKIKIPAVDVLFLTDIVEEATAATEAGMNAILLAREGNAPLTDEAKEKYTVVTSFADVDSASTLKRKASGEEDLPPTKIAKTVSEDAIVENGKEISADIPKDVDAMEVDTPVVVETPKIESETPAAIPEEVKSDSTAMDVKVVETEKIPDKTADAVTSDSVVAEVVPETAEKPSVVEETEEKSDVSNKTEEPSIENSDRGQIPNEMETDECNVPTVAVETPSNDVVKVEETIIEKTEKETEAVVDKKKEESVADVEPATEKVTENGDAEPAPEKIETVPKEIEMIESVDSKNDDVETSVTPTATEDRLKIEETEKIETDVSNSLPVTEVPIINDEKLNDLLGEKGIALEKECEEILSKVEQATSAVITNKIFTEEPSEKMDVLDEIPATENGSSDLLPDVETNGEKISVDDLVSTVSDDVLDEILPELPAVDCLDVPDLKSADEIPQTIADKVIKDAPKEEAAEVTKNDEAVAEETPVVDVKEKDAVDVVPASDNNGEKAAEVNGSGKIEIANGNGTHDVNGKNGDDSKPEHNGKTAETIDDDANTEQQKSTNTNGTAVSVSDAAEESTEIKVKKIATDEPVISEQTEQVIET